MNTTIMTSLIRVLEQVALCIDGDSHNIHSLKELNIRIDDLKSALESYGPKDQGD